MRQSLTDNEIREVLARAEEIHGAGPATDLANVLQAAQEAGLPREAVEQALRERADVGFDPEVGELVFAKSTDGKYYAARVLALEDSFCEVRFCKGGTTRVSPGDIRPCPLLPGSRVVCHWPEWGWWTCTVVNYDADRETAKVTDGWGSTRTFPVAELRLDPPTKKSLAISELARAALVYGVDFLAGAGIGALVTWLIMR